MRVGVFFSPIFGLILRSLRHLTWSFVSWPRPGCMLGASTCSFINIGPGALWELPACPFISAGDRDASAVLCVAALVCSQVTGIDHIFWVLDWARADYGFCACGFMWKNANVCACVLASAYGQRDQTPSTSRGTQGDCHFKGPRGLCTGEILFMRQGIAWQEPAANNAAWR